MIIPAKNEEGHLDDVLRHLPEWVDHAIVVDDGSTDGTPRLASASPRCTHLIRHGSTKGVGAAIAAGYGLALSLGADVCAIMAGDDQMRADELGRIVLPVICGEADYSKGNRLDHPNATRDMPWIRRVGTRSLSFLTTLVTGLRTHDAQCGYTAISSEMLRRLPLSDLYPSYGYPNDLLAILACAGARISEPIVSPVYSGRASGLRPERALFTHSWVLIRALLRRRARRRMISDLAALPMSSASPSRSASAFKKAG